MRSFINFLIRRRKPVMWVVAVLSGILCFWAPRLGIDNSLEVWFVEHDPALISYLDFLDKFGHEEAVVIAIHTPSEALKAERLVRLLSLTRRISAIDGVARVESLANTTILQNRGGRLTRLPLVDEPVGPQDLLRVRTLAAQSKGVSRFLGKDGKTLVVYTFLRADPEIEKNRGRLLDEIRTAVDTMIAGTEEHASFGGIGVLHEALNDATFRDGSVFIGLSYVAMAVALLLVLRRAVWLALALAVITLADLVLFGTMAVLNQPLNMVTLALPALVMILGVANVVHMAVSLGASPARDRITGLKAALAAVAIPCLFNALTTAAGFLSLTSAHMRITRNYGLFAAVGILLASFFALLGVAWLLPRLAKSPPPASPALARAVEKAMCYSLRHRLAVCLLTVLLGTVAFWGASSIQVDTYSMDFLPKDHAYRRESAAIETSVGPYIPLELTLTVPQQGEWQKASFLRTLVRAQMELAKRSDLGQIWSIVDILGDLQLAISGLPTDRFWETATDGQIERLLTLVKNQPEAQLWHHLVAEDGRTLRLSAGMRMGSASEFMAAATRTQDSVKRVMGTLADVQLSGYLPLYSQMITHILDDQITSFSLAFGVVFLLVGLILRSWRFMLAALVPNLLPVLMVLGVMGFSNIRLDIATVTIAAAILGIVVDDTVHILYRLRRALGTAPSLEAAMRQVARESGVAVVSTSFIFCMGFGVIALASVRSVALVGLLTTVGVASALVTDLFLLPAIVAFIFEKYPSGTKEHISQNMLGQPGKSTHLSRAPVRKQKIANR